MKALQIVLSLVLVYTVTSSVLRRDFSVMLSDDDPDDDDTPIVPSGPTQYDSAGTGGGSSPQYDSAGTGGGSSPQYDSAGTGTGDASAGTGGGSSPQYDSAGTGGGSSPQYDSAGTGTGDASAGTGGGSSPQYDSAGTGGAGTGDASADTGIDDGSSGTGAGDASAGTGIDDGSSGTGAGDASAGTGIDDGSSGTGTGDESAGTGDGSAGTGPGPSTGMGPQLPNSFSKSFTITTTGKLGIKSSKGKLMYSSSQGSIIEVENGEVLPTCLLTNPYSTKPCKYINDLKNSYVSFPEDSKCCKCCGGSAWHKCTAVLSPSNIAKLTNMGKAVAVSGNKAVTGVSWGMHTGPAGMMIVEEAGTNALLKLKFGILGQFGSELTFYGERTDSATIQVPAECAAAPPCRYPCA